MQALIIVVDTVTLIILIILIIIITTIIITILTIATIIIMGVEMIMMDLRRFSTTCLCASSVLPYAQARNQAVSIPCLH